MNALSSVFNERMLIEREADLARLDAARTAALAGHGQLVFVGGEAGVGKTALVRAAAERAGEQVPVRRGVADNVTTPAPFGSLLEAVPEAVALVDADASRLSLFHRIRAVLSDPPCVLVLEDVHWADEATLDLLRFLGRRLDGLPILILATYRSDEVSIQHPLATILGDLATAPGTSRLAVSPISQDAVTRLVQLAGSAIDPAQLWSQSGGNPFYVTEVLATAGEQLPTTIRDAVLARVGRLAPDAQSVLAGAAVLGAPADTALLIEVSGQSAGSVDECVAQGLLVATQLGWAFRHELARLAVEQSVPPGRLVELNRRARLALTARGSADDRRLAHHAAAGGERELAHRHAVLAATRAARLGAHREAAEHYRNALRWADGDRAARGRLLAALSYECYLTNDAEEALTTRIEAMALAELDGDAGIVGHHQRWASRLAWFIGRNAAAQRYAGLAITSLEPGGDSAELALAYSNRSQLCMLGNDVEGAQQWGERAIATARRVGAREPEIHALNNVATARLQLGQDADAQAMLERSLELALADDAQEHAARAYTNLGSTAVLSRQHAAAEAILQAGIAYCAERDLDSWSLYMSAQLARSRTEQGRYDEALATAHAVLRHPRLAPVSEIVATAVIVQIEAWRGQDRAEQREHLWRLASETGEAQRLVPAAVARAEAAWLQPEWRSPEDGRAGHASAADSSVIAALDTAWEVATTRPSTWEVGELAYWRAVFGLSIDTTAPVAEPFALMLARNWLAAAAAWSRLGSPLWQARALARDPSLDQGRTAIEIIDRLDVPALRQAILRDRHGAGLAVPRGPRSGTRQNPSGLTNRELDVLRLLVDGLSDGEIAARLYLSNKTVGHHVSSVLRKLDESTRARAVAAARRRGLLDPPDPPG